MYFYGVYCGRELFSSSFQWSRLELNQLRNSVKAKFRQRYFKA